VSLITISNIVLSVPFRCVIQFSSTARDPQPISLSVTWNNGFLIEGSANVIGEYSLKSLKHAALVLAFEKIIQFARTLVLNEW